MQLALPPANPLIAALRDPGVQSLVDVLDGYGLSPSCPRPGTARKSGCFGTSNSPCAVPVTLPRTAGALVVAEPGGCAGLAEVAAEAAAKAAATVVISPCWTCVTSVPAGIHTGAMADEYGALVNARGTRVGHFATVITQVTLRELLIDVTPVLGQGQITAQGVEEAAANGRTLAITGGTGRYQSAGGEIRFRDTSETVQLLQVVIDQ